MPLPTDIRHLLQGLHAPLTLTQPQWERVLRRARPVGLHARLAAVQLPQPGLPDPVRRHLLSAQRIAAHRGQALRAELFRLSPLVAGDFPVIILKGGAYLLQDRKMARGRFASDIDLLVPSSHLRAMEDRLRRAGWQAAALDAYDERYYRDWSHETPPMRFPGSPLEVDLHHAITPVTGSLAFDPSSLFSHSEIVPGTPFRVLSLEDQVLHACLHCFHDGELDLRIREVVDIDGLLREGAARPHFWEALIRRASGLGLHRPLWYGLHYARLWMDCPVPASVMERLPTPSRRTRWCMDTLIPLALLPPDPDHPPPLRLKAAQALLRARYHLLRMPPHLLLPHLAHKAGRRLKAYLDGGKPTP
ncbi:nucleotidyltransferase family protein [Zoogloea sp.]|uniref:nucleotidyltransferase domain-containing protein n=1 Tax=Zoogloea sp. TaxID=49181 RepID=UPI0026100F6F|nr:nucleotidyltransferase family protein [Zoogloea sp.]MDD3353723.1 nucleotidyltransferase family protein [Zoogloea sp.]